MSYDKVQAAREFDRWSQGYDRCILQRLLFGPSHRAIIARVGARSGDRPLAILDVGCGTGVFASRIRAASPRSTVWGGDLVSAMLAQDRARWRSDPERVAAVQGDSERLPFPAGARARTRRV
jgi:ubiquinone/menaquinone biosynthesis C-methylase UbiE